MIQLDWPLVALIVFVILAVGVARGGPNRRQHALQLAEAKAKGNEEYRTLAEKFEALSREMHEGQAAMQTDLAAVRASVASIETMMREVA